MASKEVKASENRTALQTWSLVCISLLGGFAGIMLVNLLAPQYVEKFLNLFK